MSKKRKTNAWTILGAIIGLIFATLAAPSQIAKGVEDWSALLHSEDLQDAMDKLAD